jgi:hypothetical protein
MLGLETIFNFKWIQLIDHYFKLESNQNFIRIFKSMIQTEEILQKKSHFLYPN